jgi:hypothetical protein
MSAIAVAFWAACAMPEYDLADTTGPDRKSCADRDAEQAAYERVWAQHPLRDHPLIRLSTPEEREADRATIVTFVGNRGFLRQRAPTSPGS